MASGIYTLVVGSKQLSSWSLRPWLLMKQAGIGFEDVVILLDQPDTKAKIAKYSPSGKVPLLKHGSLTVWDSLAIAEYLNERHPEKQLWPADATARAHARSASAEMHSSFRDLRLALPTQFALTGLVPEISGPTAADIRRIAEIWTSCRKQFGAGGPFLFGAFCIADAMFAPVASRFTTYGTKLSAFGDDGSAEAYRVMLMGLPAMRDWIAAAKLEPKTRDPASSK